MATRAWVQVDGQLYESPKTHVARNPHTLAENGENFVAQAKEFYGKVVSEFANKKKNALAGGFPAEAYHDPVIEFVVDGAVVDPETV